MTETAADRPSVTVRKATALEGAPQHEHHRDVQGGAARAAVFGISDGLLTNGLLILGVAGAGPSAGFVRLVGLSALISGSFSMAAGEYNSMTAQSELLKREIALEREELRIHPESEKRELTNLYLERGVDIDTARKVVDVLHTDPELALEIHTREELGISTENTGSPIAASISSFFSFALGAVVPLIPWLFLSGGRAVVTSIACIAVVSVVVACVLAHFTGRSKLLTSARQLAFAIAPGVVTYTLGRLIGVSAP